MTSSRVDAVLELNGDVVAAGAVVSEGKARLAVWTSTNGDWQGPHLVEPRDAGDVLTTASALSVAGDRFVLAGRFSEAADPAPNLWTSANGRNWEPAESFQWPEHPTKRPPQTIHAVASSGTTVVAVGHAQWDASRASATAWLSTDAGSHWRKVDVPGNPDLFAGVVDVLWTGAEFLAAGNIAGDDLAQPAVWSSPDGSSWTLLPPLDVEVGTELTALRQASGRLVVLAESPYRTYLLESADGRRWRPLPLPRGAPPVLGWPALIAASGDRLMLEDPDRRESRFWVAAAPRWAWRSVDTSLLPPARRNAFAGVASVAWGEHGLVATGELHRRDVTTGDPGPGEPRAWFSDDGSTWARAELPAEVVSIGHVTRYGSGYAAVGSAAGFGGETDPVFLVSPDGRAWSWAGFFDTGFGGGWATTLLVQPGLLVAGGAVAFAPDTVRPTVWTSTDGRVWRRALVPLDAQYGEIRGFCSTGETVLAVGMERTPDGLRPVVWRSSAGSPWVEVSAPGIPVPGREAEAVANGCDASGSRVVIAGDVYRYANASGSQGAVWTSADAGQTWQAVRLDSELSALSEQEVRDVAWTGTDWIAAGWTDTPSDRGDLSVWRSRDAVSWTHDRAVEALGADDGTTEANSVTLDRNRVWVGGSDVDRATVWTQRATGRAV